MKVSAGLFTTNPWIPIHIYITLLITRRSARIRSRIPSSWDCGRCVRLILTLWIKVKRWLVSSKPEATLSMSLNRLGPSVCLYLIRRLWGVRLKWILIFHKKSLWFYLSTIAIIVHKNAKIMGNDKDFGHLFRDNIVTALIKMSKILNRL